MIELRSPAAIEAVPNGNWQLVLWMGEAFDDATPFRAALTRSPRLWGAKHAQLSGFPHEEFEDFVEGILDFGDDVLHVYFEHSLGYLSLSSDNEAASPDCRTHSLQRDGAVTQGSRTQLSYSRKSGGQPNCPPALPPCDATG